MKNRFYLSLLILFTALPVSAQANERPPCGFLQMLFGFCNRPLHNSVQMTYDQDGMPVYNMNPQTRQRLTQPQLMDGRQQYREWGQQPAFTSGNCKTNRFGCQDCPGAEHPMQFQSPGGYTIKITKVGQNRLQGGIRQVLTKMADKHRSNVTVTSGFRSCDYQARNKVGVRRSQHLMGNAADFYLDNRRERRSALAGMARQTLNEMGKSGGTGAYCSDPAHVDTGRSRSWNWCARGGASRGRR